MKKTLLILTFLVYALTFNLCTKKQTTEGNVTEPTSVTDVDGNVYSIIKIGNQIWMAENLKVTRYRNGQAIPNVTDNTEWANLTTGAYSNYNNVAKTSTHIADVDTYGRLYNWYAINDSRNIAPAGWRVPSDDDWKELEMFLGMSEEDAGSSGWRGTDEGGKLKEEGITHWDDPNTGATNESEFTARPGGYRHFNGPFYSVGRFARFWSTSEETTNILTRLLDNDRADLGRGIHRKTYGFSVRCIWGN